MRPFLILFMAALLFAPQSPKTLEIYSIDVEGGKATLYVSPTKESLLIDTGNLAGADRDSERIIAAIRDAGLQHIDHLITTHWHRDHFGGMARLARRIPIGEFIDHGGNVQPDPQTDAFLQGTYPGLYAGSKHTVVKPGDDVAIAGLDVRILASAGETIMTALPGGGEPNPYCVESKRPSPDPGENAQSIGVYIAFGQFRVVDLGDLSDDKEFDLMCPNNPIGRLDLFMVSHHGQQRSNRELLVHAIEPRVAIMNNGPRKGGQPEVMRVLHTAPGLEDLWQLHFSQLSGGEYNSPGLFVANLAEAIHDGTAYWVKVSAREDGSFVVTNGRNGFVKAYRARRG
jgi:beta-lactamase superfamily II metal-dependent hydrolase